MQAFRRLYTDRVGSIPKVEYYLRGVRALQTPAESSIYRGGRLTRYIGTETQPENRPQSPRLLV